jgi:acyl-CoA synthetase (AMP-forming)/AMP-acid ligase II
VIDVVRHPNFEKYDVSSVRMVLHGGAPFPAGIIEEIEGKFGVPLVPYYGDIDTLTVTAMDIDAPREARFAGAGHPTPFNEVKIVDEEGNELPIGEIGEVWWRGASAGAGYLNDVELTLQSWTTLGKDGWHRMGDLGKVDERGYIYLMGRKKDMILRGGQNIYPAEIEGLLNAHPKVSNVCVVAMPDTRLGEKACAFVVPKRKEDPLTFNEMLPFLMERKLAKYKLPERLEIIDELPMVGGKVDKRELGKIVAEKLLAEGVVIQAMVDKFREEGRIK